MTEPIEILIAEDSRIQAKMLMAKLEGAGYAVRWAKDGKQALDMVREKRPAMIVSDIEMPEMTGYEFCEAVKRDAVLKNIPLILLSTLSDPEDIIRGLHVGADNYVTKPYDPQFLLSRIKDLLSTPIGEDDDQGTVLQVKLAGKEYEVKAGKQQVLNLLVSTFENAVDKNRELITTNEELSVAQDQLKNQNQKLQTLNEDLDSANQRMAVDLEAAARIQHSLLPAETPDIPNLEIAWSYLPCDELAGDFLNFFPLDDRHLAALVVDVSGHGVASSLLAVTVGRFMTPVVSPTSLLVKPGGPTGRRITPPAEVAFELNNRFQMEDQGNLYFTMIYGVLDLETREFRFVSAGHPNLVHIPEGGEPQLVKAADMAIGWMEDTDFQEHTLQLGKGDRIILYSDGIPEAMNHDLDEFGNGRMLENLKLSSGKVIDDSVRSLFDAVHDWCVQKGPKDDVSILGIHMSS